MPKTFEAGNILGLGKTTLQNILDHLKACYASHVGIEFKYISDQKQIDWLTNEVEKKFTDPLPIERKKRLLEKLNEGVIFEQFLQKKYDSFAEKTGQADCIIAINMKVSGKIPEWEELAAVSCAVQNMALTAESLRVGAYWSSPPLIDQLGDFLGLGENEKCIGLFYMGYHNEKPWAPNRTSMEEKVRWIEE